MLISKSDGMKSLNQNLYNYGKRKIPQLLTFFFGLTYIVLFVDVLVEHHIGLVPVISARLIPAVFSLLAAAVSFMTGLWLRKETIFLFSIVMGFSVLIGLIGTYLHLSSSLDNITVGIMHILPPKLAPLAFSGIGTIGILVTFGFLKPSLDKNGLVLDPVCGRRFQRSTAEAVFKVNSHTYYLCCPICVREFRKSRGLVR